MFYNCFHLKDYTLKILIVWSMNESVIQPQPFPKDLCMFFITVVKIDWNPSAISLLLITISAFELE